MKTSKRLVLLFMVYCIVGAGAGIIAAPDVSSERIPATADSSGTAEVSAPDTGGTDSTSVAFALCTLTVISTPENAAVTLDGTLFGTTPLVISNIDTGSHVLVLEKSGYYRKKVKFNLPNAGTSSLSFALTAPGRLEVVTEPEAALVMIDGKNRGVTPFTDSLMKPGTVQVVVTKDGFLPSETAVEIRGGTTVTVLDTLQSATPISPPPEEKAPRQKGKHFTMGIVAGVFSIFLLVVALVELGE